MNVLELFRSVNTFVFDMDGVLTDGTLLILSGGEFARTMDIKDGYAIHMAVNRGYRVIVITGSYSTAMAERFRQLGIREVHERVADKRALLTEIMNRDGLTASDILYMGDDLPDLKVMMEVGLPCCPADAVPEIRAIAKYVSPSPGGRGAVRDVIEKVMKLRGDWVAREEVRSV